jgi:uncharacterized protein (DUF952 family)
LIYHFCPSADWQEATTTGTYTAPSLATQGFIHCSDRDNVHVPATMLARGRTDLVVLEINEKLVEALTIWEAGDPPDPTGRMFPHVYGPIPLTAIQAAIPLPPNPDGTFLPLAQQDFPPPRNPRPGS